MVAREGGFILLNSYFFVHPFSPALFLLFNSYFILSSFSAIFRTSHGKEFRLAFAH